LHIPHNSLFICHPITRLHAI